MTRRAEAHNLRDALPDGGPRARPGWYPAALTVHIILAVGSIGVTAVLLVLTVAGLTSGDAELVRGAYVVLDLIAPYVLVPLALAALITGLFMATAGGWGLTRYYWVITKLGLALLAAIALIFSLRPALGRAADAARARPLADLPTTGVGNVGVVVAVAGAVALIVLIAVATLGVTKPWGARRHR
jgi:hypothetical protein